MKENIKRNFDLWLRLNCAVTGKEKYIFFGNRDKYVFKDFAQRWMGNWAQRVTSWEREATRWEVALLDSELLIDEVPKMCDKSAVCRQIRPHGAKSWAVRTQDIIYSGKGWACVCYGTMCVCVCVLSPSARLSACLSHLSLDTLQFHPIPRRDITSSFGMQSVGSNVNLPAPIVPVKSASFVTCVTPD